MTFKKKNSKINWIYIFRINRETKEEKISWIYRVKLQFMKKKKRLRR